MTQNKISDQYMLTKIYCVYTHDVLNVNKLTYDMYTESDYFNFNTRI